MPASRVSSAVQRRFRIATFNINDIIRRLPTLLTWLERTRPEIVCLQEIKIDDARFPIDDLSRAGYGAVWHGQSRWHGVAILARGTTPILTRRTLPGQPADREPRYIEAAVRGVLIGCVYLPNGNPQPGPKFQYKMDWFERLIAHAGELASAKVSAVIAGDYNVVPTDNDIYATKSWVRNALLQPEPRAAFQRLLDQGWVDAIRTLHPARAPYTFWSYERNRWPRDAGLRIDHMLLSSQVLPRLRAAGVDRWVRDLPDTSDHAPAWIDLEYKMSVSL